MSLRPSVDPPLRGVGPEIVLPVEGLPLGPEPRRVVHRPRVGGRREIPVTAGRGEVLRDVRMAPHLPPEVVAVPGAAPDVEPEEAPRGEVDAADEADPRRLEEVRGPEELRLAPVDGAVEGPADHPHAPPPPRPPALPPPRRRGPRAGRPAGRARRRQPRRASRSGGRS